MTSDTARRARVTDLTIAKKILLLVLVLLCGTVAAGGVGIWAENSMSQATQRLDEAAAEVKHGARINQGFLDLRRLEYRVAAEPDFAATARDRAEDIRADIRRRLDILSATAGAAQQRTLRQAGEEMDAYVAGLRETWRLAEAADGVANSAEREAVIAQIKANARIADGLEEKVGGFVNRAEDLGEKAAISAQENGATAQSVILGVGALAVLGGFALGWAIAQMGCGSARGHGADTRQKFLKKKNCVSLDPGADAQPRPSSRLATSRRWPPRPTS